MRDYHVELQKRTAFIQDIIQSSGADGIVYGNSGGKDSALVGILCKMACENTLGVQMPCSAKTNYTEDLEDALTIAKQFSIQTKTIDLKQIKDLLVETIEKEEELADRGIINISPRLRMTALYAIAGSQNRLVAGTGNRSERYVGYFTKWGDGACDFNPIADLTVTEIYAFLKFLHAPQNIIEKAPSAGLADGQTDEDEMGITYMKLDSYILNGHADKQDQDRIEKYHRNSEHKRQLPVVYDGK